MATNLYFSQKVRSEQNLYEDIIIESLKIYGQDVYYLPRDIVNEDRILGDDVPSRFNSSHKIEMYIENVDGFDGEGDLFSRFGVEIRDEATFVISRKRWEQQVARYDNEISSTRPIEGDLVYLPLSNSLFQIMHVEHEQPFYQLSNLPIYKMRCQLFEYNDEDLDTGIEIIDDIEKQYAYTYVLTLNMTRDSAQAGATIDSNGLISSVSITDSGDGYFIPPLISITPGGGGGILTPVLDSDNGKIKSVTIATGGTYGSPPTLTFADPAPTLFTVGETVTMKLASTTMTGEVSKYSDSDKKLHIIHAGAADGKYHAFTTNKAVVGLTSGAGGVVTAVFEDNKISSNEQNTDFSPSGLSFLDFTENNPFGDPENN